MPEVSEATLTNLAASNRALAESNKELAAEFKELATATRNQNELVHKNSTTIRAIFVLGVAEFIAVMLGLFGIFTARHTEHLIENALNPNSAYSKQVKQEQAAFIIQIDSCNRAVDLQFIAQERNLPVPPLPKGC